MELTFSVTQTTKVSFAESFSAFAASLCQDSCFVIDSSLDSVEKTLPVERVFHVGAEKEKDLNHVESCLEWLIDLNDGEAKLYLSDRDGVSSEYQIIED